MFAGPVGEAEGEEWKEIERKLKRNLIFVFIYLKNIFHVLIKLQSSPTGISSQNEKRVFKARKYFSKFLRLKNIDTEKAA